MRITPANHVKYLGVWFDKGRKFKVHLLKVREKADKVANSLLRMLPNVGGPRSSRRRLVASVVDSMILYAAPVWRGALEVKQLRGITESTRRRIALRVCRAVTVEAALVIRGIAPIKLLVEPRAKRMCEQPQETN